MTKRLHELRSYIREEFISHLPFTVIGVLAGVGLVTAAILLDTAAFDEEKFHMAHYIHIFFSAAAASAIFRSYHDQIWKAIPVTLMSSVLICSLSDILIPFSGMRLFHVPAEVHICAVEHPAPVLFFAAGGFVMGYVGIRFFKHCNRNFHLFHILISTTASSLYMLSFVPLPIIDHLVPIAVTLFFALVVPCLVGDIALPLFFVELKEEYLHEKVHHA